MMKRYQVFVAETASFERPTLGTKIARWARAALGLPPSPKVSPGVLYCALGLAGEAGEVADQVKRILRDDGGVLTPKRREKILKEAGDVLWYLTALSAQLGSSLEEVMALNIAKLTARRARGRIHGEGSDR